MNIIAFGSGLMLVQTWFGSRCTWIYDLFEYLFIVRTVSGVWLRCEIYWLLFVAPLLACLSWCLGSIAIFFSVQPPVHPCEKATGPEWWLGKSWRGECCFVPPDVSISRQWSPPEHRHRLRGSMKTATLALSVMFLFWGLQFLLPKQKKLGPQHAGNNHSSIQIFTCT